MAKLENKAKENPKLEQNTLSDGRISLYLEYYLGREETPVLDDNGNPVLYETGKMVGKPKVHIKHNRRKENLQLYLIAKPWKSHTNLTHPGKYFRPSKVKIMRPTSPK